LLSEEDIYYSEQTNQRDTEKPFSEVQIPHYDNDMPPFPTVLPIAARYRIWGRENLSGEVSLGGISGFLVSLTDHIINNNIILLLNFIRSTFLGNDCHY
jgi:hypothetical protein